MNPSDWIWSKEHRQTRRVVEAHALCASNGEGSPRGLEFLLDKNRLNVIR
jgi:hypothetical protein